MPSLAISSVFGRKKKHQHLVYLADNIQICGEAEGHTHAITIPPAPSTATPATPATPYLEEADGHTHTLSPLAPEDTSPSIPDETESDVIRNKMNQFAMAYEFEQESRDDGHESVDFRAGDQWDSSSLTKLASENRAALVFNHTASMVDTLSGYFRQNRTDIMYRPVGEGTDNAVAELLNRATKQLLNENSFEMEEPDIFEDMVVPGRGFIEITPNYDDDPMGKIKVSHFPWDQAILGPHRRKDCSDMEYLFKWEWVSESKLTSLYPELKDEIQTMFRSAEESQATDYSGMDDYSKVYANPLVYDKTQKAFRFMDCEEKVYEKIKLYIDLDNEYIIHAKAVPSSVRKQLDTMGLSKRERLIHNMRRTQMVGTVLLSDEFVDWPTLAGSTGPDFSLITAYAYKMGNRFYGKVRDAKDPQREINKRRSQIADQANMCVSNGWFYDDSTFTNSKERNEFLDNASSPGFVSKVANVERPPVKVERGQISPSLVQLELESVQSFRDVTNVRSELMGASAGANESGVALLHKQKLGLVGNEFLFDNYWRAKKQLGRQLVGWIQQLYTPSQVLRLVMDGSEMKDQQITPEQMKQLTDAMKQQIQEVLDRQDLLKYDVVVSETGMSPTARTAMFGLLLEAATHGLPIPTTSLLEMSDIPNKDKIIAEVQAQQQAAAQAEQRKNEVEIEKTRIAHGIPTAPAPGINSMSQ